MRFINYFITDFMKQISVLCRFVWVKGTKKYDVHSLSANIPLPQQAEVPPSKGEKVSP